MNCKTLSPHVILVWLEKETLRFDLLDVARSLVLRDPNGGSGTVLG
jgi:hypothetical protein